ncbi:MAG: Ig-like domain-containing protein [Lachnospiraceae bacterium]|nr:Ig-like domain-containing protein [Lachnospiraceae bacterium]
MDYAGTDQGLVSEGNSDDGTIEYSTDNSKWSTTVPTGKDVGTYDVWWRFTGDKNHNSLGSTKLTSKINKKALTVTPDAGQSKVFGFDDSALTYTVTGLAGRDTEDVISGSLKRETGENVGEYEISNDNLTSDNYDITVTSGVKFAITPKAITGARVMLEKSQLEYNGSEQSVVVTGVKLTDQTVLGSDDYEISGDVSGVNKGSYTVIVTGKGNYSGTATAKWAITDKPMTVAAEDVTETYDGSSYGINVVVTDPADGYEIKYGTKEGTYNLDDCPTITDAGTLTVYYKVNADNYEPYEGWAIITVNPADADVTEPAARTLDYDGTYQDLLAEGESDDGIFEYSIDNKKWSTSVPTGMNAGDYDVWWRFTGDKNHNSLGTAKLTSKINKIALTVTPDEGQSKVFGEDDPELTYAVSGLVGNDTKAVISGCLMRETGENVGEYEMSDDNLTSENYDITVTSGVKFVITQKSITDAAVILDQTQFIYDETLKTVNLIKVETHDGVLLDPDTDYTVSGNMSGKAIGDYTVTVTGKGNYKDEATVNWYIVEEIKTMDVTVDTIRTTYDGMAHGIGLRIDEPADGYTIKYENESGVFEKTDAPVITDAGTLSVSFVISAKGYEDYYGEATVIIDPASVTVKADDRSKTEGDDDPTFTATVTGLIGSVSDNKLEYAFSREGGETPGTYTITPEGDAIQGNYAVTYETGTLTILEKKDDSSSSGKDSSSSSSGKDSSSSSSDKDSSSSSGKDSSSSSSTKDSSSSSSQKDSSSSSSEKDSSSSTAKSDVTVSMDTVDGTQVKTVTFNNDVAVKQKLDVSAYVGVHKKYMVYPKGYAKVSKKTMLITPKKPGDITIIACDKENKVWVPKEIITLKADSTRVVEKTIDAVISEGIIDGKLNIEDGALTPDRWESSKPEVAKVDEKTGMITPVSEGKTTIIAYYGTGKNAAKVKFKVKVWDL